ncbi:hypothetical protein [Azospirillum argentinense]|nr:hypothetical protein [Azospirillum argentinense]
MPTAAQVNHGDVFHHHSDAVPRAHTSGRVRAIAAASAGLTAILPR